MQGPGLLSLIVWLPIAAGVVVLLLGDRNIRQGRWISLAASVATLALVVPLWARFDPSTPAFQFTELVPWIRTFNSAYALGVDGISLPLIVLTAFMTVPVIVAAWTVIEQRPAQYFAAFLIMEGLMIGVFAALDSLLFYFFWEAMLIPMFLIIGIWGGPRRVYATIKFFLYTFLGSVFMLVALIYMYLKSGDYSIASFQDLAFDFEPFLFVPRPGDEPRNIHLCRIRPGTYADPPYHKVDPDTRLVSFVAEEIGGA